MNERLLLLSGKRDINGMSDVESFILSQNSPGNRTARGDIILILSHYTCLCTVKNSCWYTFIQFYLSSSVNSADELASEQRRRLFIHISLARALFLRSGEWTMFDREASTSSSGFCGVLACDFGQLCTLNSLC